MIKSTNNQGKILGYISKKTQKRDTSSHKYFFFFFVNNMNILMNCERELIIFYLKKMGFNQFSPFE